MVRIGVIITLTFSLLSSMSLAQDVQYFYSESKKALEGKQYKQFYTMIMKAYDLHPYNQNILWHVGLAAALNNKPDESMRFLTRAININATFDLDNPNLNSIKSHPGFDSLASTKAILNTPVIQSDTAFIIEDRQLHLESVAFDPVDKTLYGGSIYKRKIIKIDSRGVVTDFTLPGKHNLGSVFGLKVDPKKRILWACSSAIPEMQHYDSTIVSALFQFDLKTGSLLNSYHPTDTVSGHLFGDLALDSNGTPYVSDSKNNIIYRFDAVANKLVPFFTSKEFWNIQGLVFSGHDHFLYISDYIKGIFRLDIQKKQLAKLEPEYDLSLKGADGLLFFDNSLITIQNGVQPNRVVRNFLNTSGDAFSHYEYIDNAHPAFGEPTIGSIAGDTIYYVANSQWNGYEKGKIKNASELRPIIVLKYVFSEVR